MLRETEFEPDINDREETESQDVIDELEAEIYDLSGPDEKIVREISKLATTHFDAKPSKWSQLLVDTQTLIQDNRKGEFDDEEAFTAKLEEKRTEANELVEM
jgi:hypothetical protein